jgi:hypothetical protein
MVQSLQHFITTRKDIPDNFNTLLKNSAGSAEKIHKTKLNSMA